MIMWDSAKNKSKCRHMTGDISGTLVLVCCRGWGVTVAVGDMITWNTNQRTVHWRANQSLSRKLWELYSPKLSQSCVSAPLIAPVHMCLETDIKIVTPLQLVILHCHADTHWSFGRKQIFKSFKIKSLKIWISDLALCVYTGCQCSPNLLRRRGRRRR